MKNSLKDLTLNVKKSIDREYDGEMNMEPNNNENQKVVDDDIILSIHNSYDDDYVDDTEDIIVDHNADDDEDIQLDEDVISPNENIGVDTIRLIKVKNVNDLSDEFDTINKTGIPAIIDLKYIQERRPAEFKKVGNAIKAFKEATSGDVVLLGSTKNVIVVAPESVRILR
jgi:hypothetical protein